MPKHHHPSQSAPGFQNKQKGNGITSHRYLGTVVRLAYLQTHHYDSSLCIITMTHHSVLVRLAYLQTPFSSEPFQRIAYVMMMRHQNVQHARQHNVGRGSLLPTSKETLMMALSIHRMEGVSVWGGGASLAVAPELRTIGPSCGSRNRGASTATSSML